MNDTLSQNDFGRKSIAELMCKYVVASSAKLISPIALDGPWGCGKTTHAKRLEQCFKSDEYKDSVKCIYWNAATADFAADPLPMFAAALYKSIPDDKKKEYGEKAFTMCCGAIWGIAKYGVCQIIKNRTGIDPKDIENAIKEGVQAADTPSDIEKQSEVFLETAGNEELRVNAAKSLIQLVRGEANDLVIIIDELDRCRPDFALRMLENIKHLFEELENKKEESKKEESKALNCKFILVMNKISMQSSISHLYGLNNEEAARYLGKYIKKNFLLPEAVDIGWDGAKEPCACQYFRELLGEEGKKAWSKNRFLREFITDLFLRKNLQLREVEKLVGTINFIREVVPGKIKLEGNNYLDCLLCFLAYLLEFEPKLTMKIVSKETSAIKVLEMMGYVNRENGTQKSADYVKYIKAVLDCFFAESEEKRESIVSGYPPHREAADFGWQVMDQWLGYAVFMR